MKILQSAKSVQCEAYWISVDFHNAPLNSVSALNVSLYEPTRDDIQIIGQCVSEIFPATPQGRGLTERALGEDLYLERRVLCESLLYEEVN